MIRKPSLHSTVLHSKCKLAYLFQISFNSQLGGKESCISKLYKTSIAFSQNYIRTPESYFVLITFDRNMTEQKVRVIVKERLYPFPQYTTLKMLQKLT